MTDYEARIVEARKAQRAVYLAAPEPVAADLSRIIKGLADAVETLAAERDALRAQLDGIRDALTKDRVVMVTRRSGYTVEDYSNPLVPVKAIEAALAEGVSDGQQ